MSRLYIILTSSPRSTLFFWKLLGVSMWVFQMMISENYGTNICRDDLTDHQDDVVKSSYVNTNSIAPASVRGFQNTRTVKHACKM